MITEKELLISNKSYTNKDFVQIFSEILTMAKELSNKFDPEASNESDPFIVLLKLLGFIGDKINYNIDKNILERFMPSATQESSMRDLCAMMGYAMHYYIAPETTINIEYLEYDKFDETHVSFQLPRYTTIVTDNEAEINYILLENCKFTADNRIQNSKRVMQGTLKDLTVLNSDKILLENIDENNRVYFNEPMVAENGVFIEGGSNLVNPIYGWKRVDNLNNIKVKDSVYRFGYDSERRLPYIEFPTDIADLIGDGLRIKYVVTNGSEGNVRAKALTKINSSAIIKWADASGNETDEDVTIVNSDTEKQPFSITNVNASINGKNPETIDEAYQGFKKTVGTFDTLVTCRDYANYIYSKLVDDSDNPLVSNIQVADRRTDINYSNQMITYGAYGQYTEDKSSDIDAFDLVLYPLKPLVDYSLSYFNDSFMQLLDTTKIKSGVEEAQTLSHNYKDLEEGDIFALKNYYKLTANISTTHKVNEAEQLGILNNINNALIKKFNARNVDFGYEIPYDELLKVIENADERIKLVNLYEPTLTTKVVFASTDNTIGEEVDLLSFDGKEAYVKLLAKNILAGKYPLFDYNNKFDYDFGQSKISGVDMLTDNIEKFTSNLEITLKADKEYTLKENEYVQFVYPSYVSTFTYPYGINYYLQLNNEDAIPKETPYQLQSGEYCIFVYTNDQKLQVVDIYKQGDILQSKEDLKTTDDHGGTPNMKTIETYNLHKFSELGITSLLDSNNRLMTYQLTQADEVSPVELNEQVLNKSQYCYWILNNPENELPFADETEYMLQNGEYFFVTDTGFTNLFSYGPGTLIKIAGNWQGADWKRPKLDVAEVVENGLLKCKDKFELFQCNDTNQISLIEQSILTLAKDDKVKCNTAINLDNDFEEIVNDEEFTCEFTDGTVTKVKTPLTGADAYLKVRTRLDLNVGYNKAQTILCDTSSLIDSYATETITFTDKDGNEIELDQDGQRFQLNLNRQVSGGIDVPIYDINYLVLTDQEIYPSLYCYEYNSNTGPSRTTDEHYESLNVKINEPVVRDLPSIEDTVAYVMLYKKTFGNLTISVDTGTVKNYYSGTNNIYDGINILQISGGANTLTISTTSPEVAIILSAPRYVNISSENGEGYNKAFKLTDTDIFGQDISSLLKNELHDLDSDHTFYYTNYVDNSKIIETNDFTEPYALYDYNNIANKWTISEIDFNANEITIVRGSRA